ncbi:hypothetical protein AG1IA_04308 [Rhizoctonia solani AG-1 IA]|uniref:Uncharacterized protein n=1 Tax=Thanatephorus cucumeris (strain AG1-IA) TaxID=983506 RepID=L8WXU3_THACA|nr:hypothetical protein AG1IA_04308 [Rhizoctonia solani AG-1 IA]
MEVLEARGLSLGVSLDGPTKIEINIQRSPETTFCPDRVIPFFHLLCLFLICSVAVLRDMNTSNFRIFFFCSGQHFPSLSPSPSSLYSHLCIHPPTCLFNSCLLTRSTLRPILPILWPSQSRHRGVGDKTYRPCTALRTSPVLARSPRQRQVTCAIIGVLLLSKSGSSERRVRLRCSNLHVCADVPF